MEWNEMSFLYSPTKPSLRELVRYLAGNELPKSFL